MHCQKISQKILMRNLRIITSMAVINSFSDRFSNIFSSTISIYFSNTFSSCFSKPFSTFSSSFSNTFTIYMLRRQFVFSRIARPPPRVLVKSVSISGLLMGFISSVPVFSVSVGLSVKSVVSTVIYLSYAFLSILFCNSFLAFFWRLGSFFDFGIVQSQHRQKIT